VLYLIALGSERDRMLTAEQRDGIVGVVLAGGRSRRMGGQAKALMPLGGRPMAAHVIKALAPQVGRCIVNANDGVADFAGFGLPAVADLNEARDGPLAGLLAAMVWAGEHAPAARWIVTAPCDTPFIPANYVERLLEAAAPAGAPVAIAASEAGEHYACGLFSLVLADDLAAWLARDERRVRVWIANHRPATARFECGAGGPDPFFNVNTPEDFAMAETMLKGGGA
jgi:molybdopterin-guanine dinucleotide biosynthesis protein A